MFLSSRTTHLKSQSFGYLLTQAHSDLNRRVTNHFNTFISYLPNPAHLVIPPRGIGHYPPNDRKFFCGEEKLHRVHFGCRHWGEEVKMEVTGWKVAEVNLGPANSRFFANQSRHRSAALSSRTEFGCAQMTV